MGPLTTADFVPVPGRSRFHELTRTGEEGNPSSGRSRNSARTPPRHRLAHELGDRVEQGGVAQRAVVVAPRCGRSAWAEVPPRTGARPARGHDLVPVAVGERTGADTRDRRASESKRSPASEPSGP